MKETDKRILVSMHNILNNDKLTIEAIFVNGNFDKHSFTETIKRDIEKLSWIVRKLNDEVQDA